MNTFSEYEQAALRTAPVHSAEHELQAREHDIVHAIMGLCTEAAEMIDALKKQHAYGKPIDPINFREEIGDAMWYVPLLCRGFGWRLASIAGTDSMAEFMQARSPFCRRQTIQVIAFDFMKAAAGLIGLEHMRFGSRMEEYETRVRDVIRMLAELAYAAGSSLDSCATRNIEKLRVRYPHKFTTEAALSRDLDRERAVLEGKGCECSGDCEHCGKEGV